MLFVPFQLAKLSLSFTCMLFWLTWYVMHTVATLWSALIDHNCLHFFFFRNVISAIFLHHGKIANALYFRPAIISTYTVIGGHFNTTLHKVSDYSSNIVLKLNKFLKTWNLWALSILLSHYEYAWIRLKLSAKYLFWGCKKMEIWRFQCCTLVELFNADAGN